MRLYWHTLRYLRSIQLYRRLWFRLSRPQINIASDLVISSPCTANWVFPARRRPSLIAQTVFRFLNKEGDLAELAWESPTQTKLWLYNQHYFDDLNAEGAAERKHWHLALLEDWVLKNLPTAGVGWEPYPTSLRIVNWLKWWFFGNNLSSTCFKSLVLQTRWLNKRLEWHLLGNHLFANAKALVFSGVSFSGEEAAHWLETGLSIIDREIREQILPDGAHFERSPMYHAIFLEDILDLINVAQLFPGRIDAQVLIVWRLVARDMIDWLVAMRHADGEFAFFNDAAFGIAPASAELFAYAVRLSVLKQAPAVVHPEAASYIHLKDSGYIRLVAPEAIALLDVAPIGPDYLTGHAHADTLSFELSLFGQRVIVNGGTSQYGDGVERLRERSTAAHSTVEINGENSSEVWGGFRVARRAYPVDLQINQKDGKINVTCSHNGYLHLVGRPVHRRAWLWSASELTVRDTVSGYFKVAVARYLLSPTVQLEVIKPDSWRLRLSSGHTLRLKVSVGIARIEMASYASEFGIVQETRCLTILLQHGCAEITLQWS